MSQVQKISRDLFKTEVMESTVPVLIDFYADWCMPCRMMAPVLDKVAVQTAGRAKVVKINVDEEPELASAFEVSSIPALAIVRGGKLVDSSMGITPAERLIAMLEKA